MKFGKFIGGGLGWALGGPIGALVGFALGAAFDNAKIETGADGMPTVDTPRGGTTQGDFAVVLVVLSAAVMKADGKILRSELNYVREFFTRQFGKTESDHQMKLLRDVLNKEIPVRQVCLQIKSQMPHALRLQLMHYLFGIADADGHIDDSEVVMIKRIASYLGISPSDFESIRAMFQKGPSKENAYKILEIDPSVTDDQVKKAYRRMAVKYHPDKVSSLGEEFQLAAKEKFQKVQEAYETIKKERGMH